MADNLGNVLQSPSIRNEVTSSHRCYSVLLGLCFVPKPRVEALFLRLSPRIGMVRIGLLVVEYSRSCDLGSSSVVAIRHCALLAKAGDV